MAHNRTRSSVSIGDVDWSKPHLNELLNKVDGWNIDNRSDLQPQEVQIRVACGWNASEVSKPALLVFSDIDGSMVLATAFPLPRGGDVSVSSPSGGGTQTRWGVVVDEREGHRAGDQEQAVFLNWLRPR